MSFTEIETAILERMHSKELPDESIREFLFQVKRVYEGYSGKIPWNEIHDLKDSDYIEMKDLSESRDPGTDIEKLVIIKLNGGLGTSMGLSNSKSVISVKEDLNFLQIDRLQIMSLRKKFNINLPLLFMSSFRTHDETINEKGIDRINSDTKGNLPVDFFQNMVPRLQLDSLLPYGDGTADSHWCPPGHGDIFLSLKTSGILDRLLDNGYRAAFISNGDNLGAIFNERILSYFLREKLEFLSEVTIKTKADLKGGVLYRTNEVSENKGPIELLETAQVESEHINDFEDVKRFAYFNINNLWVNLEVMRDRLNKGSLHLSLIRNPKVVDEQPIVQLETAMGSAIGCFKKTRVLIVPRSRFAPVKNCADLLVRRSDIYTLNGEDGSFIPDPQRTSGEPVVTLDDNYKKLADFNRLFEKLPSILYLDSLKMEGAVLFDIPIKIKGTVKITNNSKEIVPISKIGKKTLENEEIQLGQQSHPIFIKEIELIGLYYRRKNQKKKFGLHCLYDPSVQSK